MKKFYFRSMISLVSLVGAFMLIGACASKAEARALVKKEDAQKKEGLSDKVNKVSPAAEEPKS